MAWAAIPTPWGLFWARVEGGSLVELRFPGFPPSPPSPGTSLHRELAHQLRAYFHGQRTSFALPLSPQGTVFQRAVWRELLEVPYGATVTYGELAARVGRPTAARAVGGAMGANPIPILIPCHRVLPTSGGVGGFGPGAKWKRALLDLERAGVQSAAPEADRRGEPTGRTPRRGRRGAPQGRRAAPPGSQRRGAYPGG